jgi:opacity protein-like surface antigen
VNFELMMMKMMKMTGLLLLVAVLPTLGQQNFASISFGVSQPLGEYGMTEDLASNGYARAGGTIKFDAAYFPVSYLGLGGSFSFGSNFSEGDLLLEDIVTYVRENASNIIEIPDYAVSTYASGFWNYINLFIGPHFSVRATQRLYLDIRLLGGLSILRLPDQALQITYDDVIINTTSSGNKLTFGFTGGGGLRFKLSDMLALKLGVDYNWSSAKFEYDFHFVSEIADVPPLDAAFPLQTLELTAGLAYAF